MNALRAQGIRANVDPVKLTPPCAWVTPTQLAHTYLGGCVEATVAVLLITTDRPPALAHAALGELLGKALAVIEPTEPTVTNEAVKLTDNGQPLPAYRMTTTTTIG
ncbi:hypothetical protein [Nocardia salmonicida]|uniref:hypothetical protein n=1 Tax=Nocardia salmonicida TaxID=53431 RepID=UPI002E2D07CE|nr:hypothetical protein [Nocardia salmonicida]